MRLLAPAKINLHLRVGAKSDDGFHPLISWMCTVGLFDTLNVQPAAPGNDRLVELRCDDAALPTDSRNLVVRAAEALARHAGGDGEAPSARHASTARHRPTLQVVPISIELSKQIPAGGGLGGGSSDAARTLLGLNRLWWTGLSADHLSSIAAELGSDVPFFLFGASSICTGRGQIVTPIAPPRPRAGLLILPGFAVPTAEVYRRFDEINTVHANLDAAAANYLRGWCEHSAEQLLPLLVNDLERPAFELYPRLAQLREDAQALVGRPVRMSGSGSSLFTLFDTFAEAEPAADRIGERLRVKAIAVALAPQVDDDLAARTP